MQQKGSHIKADAAGTDNGYPSAYLFFAGENLGIERDVFTLAPLIVDRPRFDPGADDDFLKTLEFGSGWSGVQLQGTPCKSS